MDNISEIAELMAIILSGALAAYSVYAMRKAARESHPPIDYMGASRSISDQEPWRFRQPDEKLGIRLENNDEASAITFPQDLSTIEYVVPIIGYAVLILLVSIIGAMLVVPFLPNAKPLEGATFFFVFILVLFTALPAIMLRVGARLVRVELRKECIVFHERYGIFLRRKVKIKPHPKWLFEGAYQSGFGITVEQVEEGKIQYRFFLKKQGRLVKRQKHAFSVMCNGTVGSWATGALQHWNQEMLKQQNDPAT